MTMTAEELAARIDTQLPIAWKNLKGFDMPTGGDPVDRQVLFQAIARGLFLYLLENEAEFLKSITFDSFSTSNVGTVKTVDFDITAPI